MPASYACAFKAPVQLPRAAVLQPFIFLTVDVNPARQLVACLPPLLAVDVGHHGGSAYCTGKDEFLNIKNVSRDDMMAAHRVPPQMMGIMPSNVGGFGDVEKASMVFVRNELIPLQRRLEELNLWLEDETIKFKPYNLLEN